MKPVLLRIWDKKADVQDRGEILYDIPYMWTQKKKKDTNGLIYITKQKESHRLRKQTCCQRAGIVGELEVVMYTLMCLKWIANKELFYSTILCCSLDGGRIQWRMREELSPSAVHLKLSHLIGYAPIQNKKFKRKNDADI